MDDLVTVAILNSTNYLLEESASFVFSQLSMLDDIVEEFSPSIFEYHDNFGRSSDHCPSVVTLV